MHRLLLALALCCAAAGGCAKSSGGNAGATIGSATMEDDGTIVLQLRAEGPNGMVGDALIRYPKTHADYQRVLDHLGGLKPGQSKPVPPWPEK